MASGGQRRVDSQAVQTCPPPCSDRHSTHSISRSFVGVTWSPSSSSVALNAGIEADAKNGDAQNKVSGPR